MKQTTKIKIQERMDSMRAKGWVFEPYSVQQLFDLKIVLLQQV